MNAPNQAQIFAVGRHLVSYAAGGITVAAGGVGILYSLHGVTAEQAASLTSAFSDLGHGLTTMAGAIGTIASIAMAVWAAMSSSPAAQAQAIISAVPGTKIVTTPELAAATPNEPAIMSSADSKVVPQGSAAGAAAVIPGGR